MRILVHSSVPWSPGSYSTLVSRTVPPMVNDGHEVVLSTFYGLSGGTVPWHIPGKPGQPSKAVRVLPHANQLDYGRKIMGLNYNFYKMDVLITILDVWVFGPQDTYGLNFAPWFPVDYAPLTDRMIQAIEPALYPMTFSKWGLEVIEQAGLKAHYIPCSAPTRFYSPGDKTAARSIFNIDRKLGYLVTMVSANVDSQDRKGFGEALQGFAKFAQKHDDAMLYIHTNWDGPVNLQAMADRLGIADRVIQPDKYAYNMGMLDLDYMVNVYRASDVHLNTCKSEGFGLPILESQMCGCPVIAPNYSTTDELLFAGWKIDGQLDWAMGADSFRFRVYVDSVAQALEEAYQNRDNKSLKGQAVKGARHYDNDIVYNRYWRPALKEIERLVNKGKSVYEVAKSVSVVPVQGRRRAEPEPVPAAG